MKITLFFCAGAIYVNLHKENISELKGIAKLCHGQWQLLQSGQWVLAGIPPINGFVSKWFLGAGAVQADYLVPLFILILSGILNIGYFFPIIKTAYFDEAPGIEKHGEASMLMVVPIMITAVLSVAFGLIRISSLIFSVLLWKLQTVSSRRLCYEKMALGCAYYS
jgi:multicomponent Na+:H+ antiporter subunit D